MAQTYPPSMPKSPPNATYPGLLSINPSPGSASTHPNALNKLEHPLATVSCDASTGIDGAKCSLTNCARAALNRGEPQDSL